MDNRIKIIVGGAVVLLLLVVLAIFFFLSNVKKADNTEQGTLDNLTTVNEAVSPTPVTSNAPAGTLQKVYAGTGFSLKYPSNWGVLSCNNSQNFELDPTSPNSVTLACDTAVKPITFLMTQNLNCQGTAIKLGTHTAVKSKTTSASGYTTYRWCVPLTGGKALDITHRVDPKMSTATSQEDYSTQVEELIKSISVSQGS